MIERGRIKFDDTLGMLLDIPLNDINKDVTVKQLLNHTSGVPNYFDESVMEDYGLIILIIKSDITAICFRYL